MERLNISRKRDWCTIINLWSRYLIAFCNIRPFLRSNQIKPTVTFSKILSGALLLDIINGNIGWSRSHHLRTQITIFLHVAIRSEEHTSELQSRENLVCR